jgi:hypothetical protein
MIPVWVSNHTVPKYKAINRCELDIINDLFNFSFCHGNSHFSSLFKYLLS